MDRRPLVQTSEHRTNRKLAQYYPGFSQQQIILHKDRKLSFKQFSDSHRLTARQCTLANIIHFFFINDFIDEDPIRFKFADDTALILTADDILQLANQMHAAADNIKRWCDKWRMAVNGSKTEIVLSNYNSKDPVEIALKSDS